MRLATGFRAGLDAVLDRSLSPRLQWAALTLIMVVTLLVRLRTIGTPPLAEAQWKEIDYITISSNFKAHGFNIFQPEVTWPAAPPRTTEMEFPLAPWLTALLYVPFGIVPLTVRAVPLVCWLALVVVMFLLARRELGPLAGLGTAAAAAALPLLNPFGMTLQSEPGAVVFTACAIFFAVRWGDDQRTRDLTLAAIALSLTVLLKIETVWVVIPVAYAALRHHWRSGAAWRRVLVAGALAFVPVVGWYAWAYHLEVTGVHEFGIFRGHNKFQFATLLRESSWWITMAERFKQFSGGSIGLLIVLVGCVMVVLLRKRAGVFLVWGLTVVAYSLLVADGQLDAPYRQLHAIPVLAVLFSLGVMAGLGVLSMLWQSRPVPAGVLVLPAVLLPLLLLSLRHVAENPDPLRWEAAQAIDRYSAPGDTLVVAGEYDLKQGGNDMSPMLYYYADRQGWTLQPGQCTVERVEQLAQHGAALFVELPPVGRTDLSTCSPSVRAELEARYTPLHDGEYVILGLTPTV